MNHVVDVEKEGAKPAPQKDPKRHAVLIAILCVPVIALSVYSWVARPEFIWGPRPRPRSPQIQAANLRGTIFLLSRRVEAYRARHGSYPQDLEAIGRTPGVTYRLLSENLYELSAPGPGGAIVYRSDEPVDQFVGNSLKVLGTSQP